MCVMNSRITISSLSGFLAVAIVAAAFSSPSVVCAGVVIEGEQKLLEGEPGTRTSVAISDGKVRTESVVNGQKSTMIYRSDKDLFWIVDDAAGTYREITRSDMNKMMKQVDKALQKVREQFESLPPEQRKLMKEMMGSQLGAFGKLMGSQITAFAKKDASPDINYVKIGDGGEVNGWSTVKYEGKLDGTKVSEVWAAPASVVNVGPVEMKTMESMISIFREFAGKIGMDSLTVPGPEGGLEGLPIKVIIYSDGAPASAYTVTSIEQRDLPASDFEVPPEYTKEALTAP